MSITALANGIGLESSTDGGFIMTKRTYSFSFISNANKPTQIVRVPTTYNLKYTDADGKHPYVKQIINSYQKQPENGHKGYYELSYIKSLVTMAERGNSNTHIIIIFTL